MHMQRRSHIFCESFATLFFENEKRLKKKHSLRVIVKLAQPNPSQFTIIASVGHAAHADRDPNWLRSRRHRRCDNFCLELFFGKNVWNKLEKRLGKFGKIFWWKLLDLENCLEQKFEKQIV